MTARLVQATPDLARYVAERMRPADAAEVWRAHHWTPAQAIDAGLDATPDAQVLVLDDEPALVCGVAPLVSGHWIGVPWMLGTGRIEGEPWEFLRVCRQWVGERREHWRLLVNYTDAEAVKTHRWLQWLGFTLDPPQPYGREGCLFHRFMMRV